MRSLIPVAILLFLVGCEPAPVDGVTCSGNCYIITGRVVDTASNTGLQGVELKFKYHKPTWSINHTQLLGTTTSDANGDYTFKFDGTNYTDGSLSILATKSGYFYHNYNLEEVKNFNLDPNQFDIPWVQNLTLFRLATLRVHVRATTITNFDFLTVGYHYGLGQVSYPIIGRRPIDTTLIFKTAGDIRTFMDWKAIGPGININRKDTLITTAGGTLLYDINL